MEVACGERCGECCGDGVAAVGLFGDGVAAAGVGDVVTCEATAVPTPNRVTAAARTSNMRLATA